MVTMQQRITQLKDSRQLSTRALAQKLSLPFQLIEKFETGRQTPSKEQQQTLATFFGVSVEYLRGETNDPARTDNWMEWAHDEPEAPASSPAKPEKPAAASSADNSLGTAFFNTPAFNDMLSNMVRREVRSDATRDIIRRMVKEEIQRQLTSR